MLLGGTRFIPFLLTFTLLALVVGGLPNDGHAQPVPVTDIENTAGDSVLTVFEDGAFTAYGDSFNGTIPAEGEGTRMMWHPAKGALRAGDVDATEWNDTNIGLYSMAFGSDPIASGSSSAAMGRDTEASGDESTAMGSLSLASGEHSTAMGQGTTASGDESTAIGDGTEASGNSATAMGDGTEANGPQSTAMGYETTASGHESTAMGRRTDAATEASLSIGVYNDANRGNDDDDQTTGPLFVVGNGTSVTSRSDALVLDRTGNLTIAGTLTENSDRRLKEQIQPLRSGVLGALGDIEPVRFRFKNEETHPSGTQLGLIAQEVQAQFPALVSEGASGHLSVSYSKFTAVLLKGLQEQQAEIARLEAKVNRMDQLEARLATLEQKDTSRLAALGGPWLAAALLAIGLLGLGLFVQRQQRT
jgi:hypothetical protein